MLDYPESVARALGKGVVNSRYQLILGHDCALPYSRATAPFVITYRFAAAVGVDEAIAFGGSGVKSSPGLMN